MLGTSSFSALVPEFTARWGLSNTDAGWISGIYFAGYVVAVPTLVGSTDRIDPRRVYILSLIIGGIASVGFAVLAQGLWTALPLRALAGIGLAGTYMPGLKLLTDRATGARQSRYVAYYTGGFSLGTAASFAFTGEVAQWLGWRAAFWGAGVGALAALALALALIRPARPGEGVDAPPVRNWSRFRPVFANRAAMAFIFGYAGHMWELFALRAWLVAFLAFAARRAGGQAGVAAASWLTMAIVLLSTAASIYGAEVAARADRRRIIGRIMLLSVLFAAAAGFSAGWPMAIVVLLCLAYHMIIMADSAALTGGAVVAALPGQRGVTLAVHTIVGFAGAFVGPLAVGAVLDLAGGEANGLAWGLAFLAMGAGSAAGFVGIRRL
jgi:MFS family permease